MWVVSIYFSTFFSANLVDTYIGSILAPLYACIMELYIHDLHVQWTIFAWCICIIISIHDNAGDKAASDSSIGMMQLWTSLKNYLQIIIAQFNIVVQDFDTNNCSRIRADVPVAIEVVIVVWWIVWWGDSTTNRRVQRAGLTTLWSTWQTDQRADLL